MHNGSNEYALTFINNTKNSDRKSIESPILEILLSYQYEDEPVNEFLDGYVNTSSVRSYSNSSVINLSIKTPMSWKELDGDSPAMLKKFRSNYGTGKEIITIVRQKLPKKGVLVTNNKTIRLLIIF